MYGIIKKNTAQYILFPLVDADGDFVSGATITGEFNYWEDGTAPQASFTALTNAEVEIGSTGVYRVLLTTGETNHGYVTFKFTSATSKPQLLEFRTMTNNPEYIATTASGALVWASATRALTDKAGFTISGTTQTFDALDTLLDSAHGAGSWLSASGFSTHSAADIWTAGSRALTTPNDYKATGFSTHAAADIWSVVTRQLSGTIADFDALDTALDSAHGAGSWLSATGFSTHAAADIWTAGTRALSTPNDYKATGFSVHAAADIWSVGTRVLTAGTNLNDLSSSDVQTVLETNDLDHLIKVAHPTGDPVADSLMDLIMNKDGTQTFARADDSLQGISEGAAGGGATAQEVWEYASPRSLSTPADYKATGFSTHNAAAIWSVGTREITGGALTTPADYKATGFSTHNAAAIWTAGSRELSTPNNYKADVSALATSAALTTHDTDIKAETLRLRGLNGEFIVAEYTFVDVDNTVIEFWQYNNETNFNIHNKSTGLIGSWILNNTFSSNKPTVAKSKRLT